MMESKNNRLQEVISYLPDFLQDAVKRLSITSEQVNEIRLRVNQPAVLMLHDGFRLLCTNHPVSVNEIREVFEKLCRESVYSHQHELAMGFVTLPGGHRAGIGGEAAYDRNGCRTIKYISYINIRMANEWIGCASAVYDALFQERLRGALIAGPPCSGKTSVLRDLARLLSSAPHLKKVVLVDERSELASMYRGCPQNTLGIFCDVLSNYPKGEGILTAVRTMSPDVVICDEISGETDARAVREGLNAGVTVISSIHSCNVDELYKNRSFQLLRSTGAFQKVAFLKGGNNRSVLDSVAEVSLA